MVLFFRYLYHRLWRYCRYLYRGKILTILLSFYAIIVFAILTATVVNYFSELQKAKYNDSILEFMHKLEHLDTLSKEELRELSKKVSKYKLKKEHNI